MQNQNLGDQRISENVDQFGQKETHTVNTGTVGKQGNPKLGNEFGNDVPQDPFSNMNKDPN